MAKTSRKGRKAQPSAEAKSGIMRGLPRWVQDHAREARRGAKTPLQVVQRWGGMLDGVLGRYLAGLEADAALEMGADWEGLARTITPLAEARRKMAATEAELTPRGGDGAHITHDLPGAGPGMWQGPAETTIATVTGDGGDETE